MASGGGVTGGDGVIGGGAVVNASYFWFGHV
jgi:hypothetical protein